MRIDPKAMPPVDALALKPAWIHDLLVLWRRNQLLALLLEQAGDYTAQEVRSPAVRRICLEAIADLFVDRLGNGKQARTLTQNAWATYSRNFSAAVMAPAYLVHLVARRPLAYAVAAHVADQWTLGSTLDLAELRRALAQLPDAHHPAELEALLRTLHHFGVLAWARPGAPAVMLARLPVEPGVFPLLVWSWWLCTGASEVGLDDFRRSPLFAFVESQDFAAGWAQHPGKLWTVEEAGGSLCARLHPTDRTGFVRVLLNLLSTGGRQGRPLPKESDAPTAG
jgi:hypothetical protein